MIFLFHVYWIFQFLMFVPITLLLIRNMCYNKRYGEIRLLRLLSREFSQKKQHAQIITNWFLYRATQMYAFSPHAKAIYLLASGEQFKTVPFYRFTLQTALHPSSCWLNEVLMFSLMTVALQYSRYFDVGHGQSALLLIANST